MKITMYELLGMVKDGKAPKKIKYENREYYLYDNKSYLTTDKTRFFDRIYFSDLNIEIEIIEEEKKIPEKLIPTSLKCIDNLDEKIEIAHIDTISVIEIVNQLIDYLKSKGE